MTNVSILENVERRRKVSLLMVILSAFFFFFTFVPTTYSFIRLGLLVLLCFVAIVSNGCVIKYDKKAAMILLAYVLYSAFTAVLGIANDGSLMALRTNVIYPFLFFFTFIAVLKRISIETLTRILIACAFFVAAADLWVAFYSIGVLPIAPSILFQIDLGYIFNSGFGTYYQYTSTHMVSHFFLAPFVTTLVVKSFNDRKINYKLIVIMVMQLLCIYFSGRAALVLSYCITFALIIVYGNRDKLKKRGRAILNKKHIPRTMLILIGCLVLVAALIASGRLNIGGVFDYVAGKLHGVFSASSMLDTRASQRMEYISGWLESPIFGHGMGTGVSYYRANMWINDKAIELTYIQMLYQTGIIGVVLFAMIAFYAVRGLHRKVKKGELKSKDGLPYLFGLIGILLGAESNPYLFTMGCIWMLYLPFSMAAMDSSLLVKKETII